MFAHRQRRGVSPSRVEHCSRFESVGVYYAATPNEAQMCRGTDVCWWAAETLPVAAASIFAERAQSFPAYSWR